jgi:signal transduction histidine kinase
VKDQTGLIVGAAKIARDITQRKKTEQTLMTSERLAAVGRLAATVAHEINNPLEAVGNLIYLGKVTPGVPRETVEHLTLAEQELERVAHITRQTLGFYRESNEPGPIDIAALVDWVLRLYSNKLESKNICVECELGKCPPMVGVAGELKQVISNLVANSIDAVTSGGKIRIRMQHQENGNGGAVQLLIDDDGPGIPPENVDRIFEPFFTTKKDVGTGLGLWVSREIIERHGGSIQVHSRDGNDGDRGASFLIHLPCHASREAEPPLMLPVA